MRIEVSSDPVAEIKLETISETECVVIINEPINRRTVYMHFNTTKKVPSIPLKVFGEQEIINWEIPVRWAIDNDNDCFMDNGHGGYLFKVTKEKLIAEIEEAIKPPSRENLNKILEVLGENE